MLRLFIGKEILVDLFDMQRFGDTYSDRMTYH